MIEISDGIVYFRDNWIKSIKTISESHEKIELTLSDEAKIYDFDNYNVTNFSTLKPFKISKGNVLFENISNSSQIEYIYENNQMITRRLPYTDRGVFVVFNVEFNKIQHRTSKNRIKTIIFNTYDTNGSGKIWKVKLQIPEDAKRSSATSRKCRASKAIVLAIYDSNGNNIDSISSDYDFSFVYEVGKTMEVENFDENRWNECSNGIHFFITRREAELYIL
jgi:hypothetical protein